LWLISCCAITGCNHYRNLTATPPIETIAFSPAVVTNAKYLTQFDIYGKHLSGIMLFKRTTDSTERIVFTNEMGFKFFDFEISADTFKTIYMLDRMNKPYIVNTLYRDLAMLCAPGSNHGVMFNNNGEYNLYRQQLSKNEYLYYYIPSNSSTPNKIEMGTLRKAKVVATISNDSTGEAQNIDIQHKNIKLRVRFTLIK